MKLGSDQSGPYNNLDGYKFVSNSRKACLGGGVAFYVKNSLQFNVINELFVMDEKIFESLFIHVQEGKETIVCGTIYRSPVDLVKAHLDFRLQLIECLEKLDAKRKCYIFGDFNYDLAKSNENTTCLYLCALIKVKLLLQISLLEALMMLI